MGGKGSGRPFGDKNKIDAFDPDTWPANDKRRLERDSFAIKQRSTDTQRCKDN